MSKIKIVYLDLLRIIACYMVITIHVVSKKWYSLSPSTFEWSVLNIYDCFSRSAVPLFFMISGTLFLNKQELKIKDIFKKNITHLIIWYIIWSILYSLIGIKPIHLWYIPSLIGVYLLIPVLYSIVHYEYGRYTKYYLTIFLFFEIIKNTILNIPGCPPLIKDWIQLIPIDYCKYTGYFILGYYLNKSKFNIKRIYYIIIFIMTVGITVLLSQLLSNAKGVPAADFYGYFGIFTFVEACCIFLIFKDIKIQSCKINNILDKISGCIFGVYLIHIIIIDCVDKYFKIDCVSFYPLLWTPALVTIIFTICLLVIACSKKDIKIR